jgi:hypothetical protein
MKNTFKFLGIIAFIAVIAFTMVSCGEPTPQTPQVPNATIYDWADAGYNYSLTITENANSGRAALAAGTSGSYSLKITAKAGGAVSYSSGTATGTAGGGVKLDNAGSAVTITITETSITVPAVKIIAIKGADVNITAHTNTVKTSVAKAAVAELFRFDGGNWDKYESGTQFSVTMLPIQGAVSALGENTFTITGGGVNVSFTNVYTAGGSGAGGFYVSNGVELGKSSSVDLYDGFGRIGIVIYADMYSGDDRIIIALGKTLLTLTSSSNFNYTDVQDRVNGELRIDKPKP